MVRFGWGGVVNACPLVVPARRALMKTRTILIGVAVLSGASFMLLIALCAGGLFLGYRNVDTHISPRIDELFAAIDRGAFGDTYSTDTTPEFRQVTSKEEYEQIGTSVHARLGQLHSKRLVRFNAGQFNATTYTDVVYSATFEKGRGTIRARLRRTIDGDWRLVSFHVSSPEFAKDLATKTCPHCGSPHPTLAKFCPECGEQIVELQDHPSTTFE